MSEVSYCDNCGEPLVFYGAKGHDCKPKRTISLEAYIKMQNDWMIFDKLFPEFAKSRVDSLLEFNGVEVES